MNVQSGYRKMLLELDRGLRPSELEAMKYFCSDQIPARQREEITRPVRLWEVLEERELLRSDNTVFLKKLLRDAAGAREDLHNIVTQYEEQYTKMQNDSPSARSEPCFRFLTYCFKLSKQKYPLQAYNKLLELECHQ